ncbi:hypothetical protein T4D_3263 [Trichinella pseudospiralis]|uniref:C2H2-type domain-containing protein n=1 Tax=Trichinella pseudospiralis TaxID=6337 RepID=A0A0V1F912_TRIPS|nr:hypothetical protein T4D_3263 [Trichinella pseudospiralis]
MANDHLSQTSYSEVITQLPAVLMYLIFTISDSTRKRVLALLLLALCNSCLVVHGHKITKDALNISTSMKCEQWLGQSREIIWCIGERNAVCVAIRRKTLDGKKRCNVEGCKERFLSQLQLMEHANTYSGGLKPGPASAHEKGPTEEFIRPRDSQVLCSAAFCEVNASTSEGLLRRYAQQRYDSTGARAADLRAAIMNVKQTVRINARGRVLKTILKSNRSDGPRQAGEQKTAVSGPASAHEKGPTEEFIRPRDRQRHFHRTTCEIKSLPRTSEGLLRRYAQQRYDRCRKRFDSELQLMEHVNTYSGGLKPYMCEEDGCQRAYCCRSSLQQHMKRVGVSSSQKQELKSPKDKRKPVAKTSLTPLRYYGGTCSRSAHSNHESKTNPPYKCTEKGTEKDSTARGRMQADLLLQTIPSTAYEEGASEKAVHRGNREILRPAALLC